MNVLIADDEKNILELLVGLIDWNSLGIELLCTTTSGIYARDQIMDKKPDIVITDIRMPGCDGLSIIQQAHEAGLKTQFIVISGYKYFEYAQRALRYGVREYLLKPINAKQLNNALKKAISYANQTSSPSISPETSNSLTKDTTAQLHNQFMNDYVLGQRLQNWSLEQINQAYKLSFRPGFFLLVDCRIDFRGTTEFETSVLDIVSEGFQECFHDDTLQFLTLPIAQDVIFLINSSEPLSISRVCRFQMEVNDRLRKFSSYALTVGVSTSKTSLRDAQASYVEVRAALDQRIILGINRVIPFSNWENTIKLQQIYHSAVMQDITISIESFNMEKLKQQVLEVFSATEAANPSNGTIYRDLSKEILLLLLTTITRLHLAESLDYKKYLSALDARLDLCPTVNVLTNTFLEELAACFRRFYDFDNPPIKLTISNAKKYIANHYAENLTLEIVAKYVFLNPFYFSYSFKQETGVNFTTYLNELRISISQQLMQNANLSINEISEKCGFASPQYFSKIFKKYIGMNPREYRKRLSNVQDDLS